jgi:hypothetical protein
MPAECGMPKAEMPNAEVSGLSAFVIRHSAFGIDVIHV